MNTDIARWHVATTISPDVKGEAAERRTRCDVFAVIGPSNEPLTCAVFETYMGLELRLSYSDGFAMESESFPAGPDLTERIVAKAVEWTSLA